MKIAELKQSCPRPEVVEVWDVTAQDPRLLVYLKARAALRCPVPAPFHRSAVVSGGCRMAQHSVQCAEVRFA